MDGRRDLAKVAHGGLDGAGQRLSFVDVERAAVVQHHAEIVVAAEGVVPRRPVDQHRRFIGDELQARADHRLIGAEHPLGVDDALRVAGRARSEQDLGNGVGSDLGMGCVDRGGGRCRQKLREQRRGPLARIGGDDDLDAGRHRGLDGARERLAVGGKHQARRQRRHDRLQLAEVARHQRVGHRDRRIGNARHLRSEPQQRMLDVVAGQDRDRPFGRERALQQRLRDGAHLREHLRVAARPPRSVRRALRQEHAVRRGGGPMLQPLGQLVGIGAERMRRAQIDGAVGPAIEQHLRRRELHGPQRRHHGLGVAHRFSHAAPSCRAFRESPSTASSPRRCSRRPTPSAIRQTTRCSRCYRRCVAMRA